jgi:hypothetical protein
MKRIAAAVALLLVVASCTPAADPPGSPAQSRTTTPSAEPSVSASAQATVSPTAEASDTPIPTIEPSASPPGAFAVAPNASADALFLTRDTCENVEDGYRVQFPDDWWTNTAIGTFGPCAWFSPTHYEVPDPSVVPAEIAITITLVSGDVGWLDEIVHREEGIIGRTQPAIRVEVQGSPGEGGVMPSGWRETAYVVQLGPTPEEGPNLVVRTNTEMGGDYPLNVAVIDRMMATMELIGVIQ